MLLLQAACWLYPRLVWPGLQVGSETEVKPCFRVWGGVKSWVKMVTQPTAVAGERRLLHAHGRVAQREFVVLVDAGHAGVGEPAGVRHEEVAEVPCR